MADVLVEAVRLIAASADDSRLYGAYPSEPEGRCQPLPQDGTLSRDGEDGSDMGFSWVGTAGGMVHQRRASRHGRGALTKRHLQAADSTFSIFSRRIRGCRAAIRNKAIAGPSGRRRPCS